MGIDAYWRAISASKRTAVLSEPRHYLVLGLYASRWSCNLVFTDEYYEKERANTARACVRLLEDVMPQIYEPGQGFMHDNAPIHTAHVSQECLERLGIWTINHPPYSPDLNPIEHLWPALKQLVFELHTELKTMHGGKEAKRRALKGAIRDAFDVMLQDSLWDLPAKLIASMPRRLQAVCAARGFQTGY